MNNIIREIEALRKKASEMANEVDREAKALISHLKKIEMELDKLFKK